MRGTGNMLVPARSRSASASSLLVPLSPLLIFGIGPIPGVGIAGGGVAVVLSTRWLRRCSAGTSGPGAASLRLRLSPLRWALFRRHPARRRGRLGQHAADHADLRARRPRWSAPAGGPDAVAGYGTGARLEYLLIPLVFGLGAPLVALVGTNIGAGQRERALRIALIGGATRLRDDRNHRACGRALAASVARAVRHRSARCSRPAAPTCASSGRSTASSVSASRSTSPRRVPADCSGRCCAASFASSSRSAAAGSRCA